MTDQELIALVHERAVDEFTPMDLGQLSRRIAESSEVQLALAQRVRMERLLTETLARPPFSAAEILAARSSRCAPDGAWGEAISPLPATGDCQRAARPRAGEREALSRPVWSWGRSVGIAAAVLIVAIPLLLGLASILKSTPRGGDAPSPAQGPRTAPAVEPGMQHAIDQPPLVPPTVIDADDSPSDHVPAGFEAQ